MLRRVTPLGWPRSLYKSDVKCCFLEFWIEMAKWPWRSWSMTPIFNTSWENSKMYIWCKFCDFNKLSCRQAKFPRILSQNGQNDLEGQDQSPHFQYQLRVSHNACANLELRAQICEELSCRQGKFYRQMLWNVVLPNIVRWSCQTKRLLSWIFLWPIQWSLSWPCSMETIFLPNQRKCYISKVFTNERRCTWRCICNIFSHWLRPC